MASGKAKSKEYPNGKRRVERSTGLELAPHSLRKQHRYLKDCDETDCLTVAQIKKGGTK